MLCHVSGRLRPLQPFEPPRFCKGGQFSVELKPFMEILNETDQFFGWVVKEMLPLRKAQGKSLGKPNGKSSA
jgi:hypothetical protein